MCNLESGEYFNFTRGNTSDVSFPSHPTISQFSCLNITVLLVASFPAIF